MRTGAILLLACIAAGAFAAAEAAKVTEYKPLGDKVLVRFDLTAPKGVGKAEEGVVAAAGPGTAGVAMDVKAGDRVVVARLAGVDVRFDDQAAKDKYTIVRQGELLGLLSAA